jgi:hypothetical protein
MWRGPLDIGLGIDAAVAEITLRLAGRDAGGLAQARRRADDRHALAAAAGRSLDQQRKADRLRADDEVVEIAGRHDRRRHRHALRLGEGAGRDLVAHQRDGVGGGADEDEAGRLDGGREAGVLRQEAVARMDGVGAGGERRRHDRVDVEMGGHRRLAGDRDRLARHGHVPRPRLDRVMDRHRGDAHGVERADHAAGDLAAVGDEDLAERRLSPDGFCHASSPGSGHK